MRKITFADVKRTENGVAISGSIMLEMTRKQEGSIARDMAHFGYKKLSRERLIRKSAKRSDKPLFLNRSE